MSLKDIFEEGREAQKNYLKKQRPKIQPGVRKQQKMAWWNPMLIVRGMGVVYEMSLPYLSVIRGMLHDHIGGTLATMKKDLRAIGVRLRLIKPDEGYYNYRRYLDLMTGKK